MKQFLSGLLVFIAIPLFSQLPEFGFPDNFKSTYYSYEEAQPGVHCLANQFILKIKPEYRNLCEDNNIHINELQQVLNSVKAVELKKIYPHHQPPTSVFDQYGRRLADLTLVYNITYSSDLDVRKIISELNGLKCVEYAQPRFIETPMWLPNDTSLTPSQWYLFKIRADLAWDLDTGNYATIIGVVDGGTDFFHPDLMQNIYYDYTDSIGSGDEDNDGFLDNFRGWDVGDNDNYPQYIGAHNSAHGTSMCGLAAASTNNYTGMAGAGYKCSYMPVKMVNSVYGWIAGYEGLVYAADHGAKVINASWGGTIPGPYGQDVVNYVSINQNRQIFAAAGNSNNTVPFYPASYDGVVCVGGTRMDDTKSASSSYYEQVDIVSPAFSMFAPYSPNPGGYGAGGGTSDATALTTGTAGLVQNYYSTFIPSQIGAILQQSSYRIDTIPGNLLYLNKQGAGRLDMYAALTNPMKPFIYYNARTYVDNNDDVLMIGDTIELGGNMLNLLDTSSASLTAIITDNSGFVTWIDSSISLGVLNTLEYANINSQPFIFTINTGCPLNQTVLMKVTYYDGTDTLNTQYFTFVVNRDYYNVEVNKLRTTVTTSGRIGFSDNRTLKGVGYRFDGTENNLLGIYWNPMGLFLSKGSTHVSDQTLSAGPLGPCCNWANDADIVQTQNMVVSHNGLVADLEVVSEYNDSGAGVNAVGVDVKQKLWGWSDSINDQFLILEYSFRNNSGMPFSDWYAGLFGDFDCPDSLLWNADANIAFFDTLTQTAITHSYLPRYFVGYKILSPFGQLKYYANHNDGSASHQYIYDGFTSGEKFNFMNPTVPSNSGGITDVSQYLGLHFDTLYTDGCIMMHVALLIGTSLSDIQTQANLAVAKYNATFNIWTGNGGNSNWHHAANWTQNSVPDFNDHVIIPDTRGGSGFSPVISIANGMVKNIEIRCGGRLDVNPPFKLQVGN